MFKSTSLLKLESFSKGHLLLSLGVLTSLIVLAVDVMYLDISLYKVSPPKFEIPYLFRTVIIILSSWLIVSSVPKLHSMKADKNRAKGLEEIWTDWRSVSIGKKGNSVSISVKKLIFWATLGLSVIFLLISMFRPDVFKSMQSEGQIIEFLSAAFLFVSSAIFFYLFAVHRQRLNRRYLMIFLTFALVFFIIGMEEVSWFQRVLSIDTPAGFEGNSQSELNLHNFKTDIFQNLYFFAAFIFLIVLPFVNEKTGFHNKFKDLSFFIPSRFIIYVSALAFVYNFNLWNVFLTQLAFFVTLFILIHYDRINIKFKNSSVLLPSLIAVYILTQAIFLAFGGRFKDWNDIHEYKEFFIPLSLLIYSIETVIKAKKI